MKKIIYGVLFCLPLYILAQINTDDLDLAHKILEVSEENILRNPEYYNWGSSIIKGDDDESEVESEDDDEESDAEEETEEDEESEVEPDDLAAQIAELRAELESMQFVSDSEEEPESDES